MSREWVVTGVIGRGPTIPDDIRDETRILGGVGALRREVAQMAVTVAELKASIDTLTSNVAQLLGEADLTPLKDEVDALNNQVAAALQPPPPAATPGEPAAEPTPSIDPNTGQPVQPV